MLKLNSLIIAFFLVSIIGYLRVEAQEAPTRFKQAGNLEDYSSVITNCIFQDTRGLIWIGTDQGLDRWDGHKIYSYTDDPPDNINAPYWGVQCITEDDRNNLWLASSGSLINFDLESEKFTRISPGNSELKIGIDYLKFQAPGIIWLGTNQGLFSYLPEHDSILQIPFEAGYYASEVMTLDFDTTGQMWVAFSTGLYYYDSEYGKLKPQPFNDHEIHEKRINCVDMSMDKDGSFWIVGPYSRLLKFNPYTRTTDIIREKSAEFTRYNEDIGEVQADKQNDIWFRLKDGIMKYDPRTGVTLEISTPKNQLIVNDLFEDSDGNMLLATMEGIKTYDSRAANINSFDISHDSHIGEERWITEIVRNDQTFWIGTYESGLIKVNAETGELENIREEDLSSNLASDAIIKILKDKNDRIWVLAGRELQCYDSKTNSFESSQYNIGIFSITSDVEKIFWGWDHMGEILRFDPSNQETSIFSLNDNLVNVLVEPFNSPPIYVNSEGILWLMGGLAITKIDPQSGNWMQFEMEKSTPVPRDKFDEPPYFDNITKIITDIFYDSKNRIWVGTNRGLYLIDTFPGSDSISWNTNYPEYPKFGQINRIVEDATGNIWIGSYSGIYVILTNGTISKLTYKDGLPESPRMIRSLNADPNGSIYAGTIDFLEILPDFLKSNETIPPVLLTDFSVNGLRIYPGEGSSLKKSIFFAKQIELRHNQNFIRIDFSALNYDHPEKNQYRYLLEGIDKDTVYAMERTYAEYTSLAPGNYTFWVTGSNNTGLWNPEGTSITIRVHPPWYKTQLALAVYILLIITLILVYIRIRTVRLQSEKNHLETEVESRIKEIRQKNQQILELDSLKTRFFNNISHEFRTLVTMVKAPAESLLEEEKVTRKGQRGLEVIYRNANMLMKLVNQLLDISRIDKKCLNLILSEENIFDIAHATAISFAPLAEVKGIQYRYYLPKANTLDWIDADKIEKILNNLLSNAFKFTPEGGKVRLEIIHKSQSHDMKNLLEISVSDTGKGIHVEEQQKIFDRFYQAESNLKKEGGGTGIGLALTRDLIELMHGVIKLESKPGKGSTFTVLIPLGRDHLAEDEYSICDRSPSPDDMIPESTPYQDVKKGTSGKESEVDEKPPGKPQVLVVEDNADILWLIASKMEGEFSVLEAVDGSAGLKLAREHMPDLIITDLMMPRMDGYKLCEKLKTDIRTSHIPVIMLTAKASLDDKMQGLETGADDYITKPFEIKEVIVRSRNLVEQRKKLREKFTKQVTLDPRDIVITSTDERFLTKVMDIIEHQMSNDEFDVSVLCEAMNMSRSTLFRKIDALTNQSPVDFIRTLRLKRAAVMLKEKYGNISEVALEVGFSNPSYFAKMFKKTFSVSPSTFAKMQST